MSKEEGRTTTIYTAYEEYLPHDPAAPEKNLLRAILLSAMLDLRKPGDASRRAAEYFLSPEDDYIFSFNAVCDYLNIDPDRILMVTGLQDPAARAGALRGEPQPDSPAAALHITVK